eukprot:5837885-Pleurochrysis_carterae.AAC.1
MPNATDPHVGDAEENAYHVSLMRRHDVVLRTVDDETREAAKRKLADAPERWCFPAGSGPADRDEPRENFVAPMIRRGEDVHPVVALVRCVHKVQQQPERPKSHRAPIARQVRDGLLEEVGVRCAPRA